MPDRVFNNLLDAFARKRVAEFITALDSVILNVGTRLEDRRQ